MEKGDKLDFLRSKKGDEAFHASRIMFCIKDGEIEVAPLNAKDSHLEWFKKEGWCDEESAEEFMEKNIRGFFLPTENKLYCYRGVGFSFDDNVRRSLADNMGEIKEHLGLNDETEINLGSKDEIVNGSLYPKEFAGKLKDFIKGRAG